VTKIKFRSPPIYHETNIVEHGRVLCVAETPSALFLRLKGTREVLTLPWGIAYVKAAYLAAEAQHRAVKSARREKALLAEGRRRMEAL
jgi:hypothetical protein